MNKILSLLFVLIVFFAAIYLLNDRKVDLLFIASGRIVFPRPPYHAKEPFFIKVSGEKLDDEVCKMLNWLKYGSNSHQGECEIILNEKFHSSANDIYYVCVGCRINSISYSYISKFFIPMNDKSNNIEYFSSNRDAKLSAIKDGQSISVYRGNVFLTP
ncbi:hypothetical protein [Desulfogranum japonicum]|uniref:hypothetical protein n=1 Tax=Desulfogranum japonicum TaxID=231447 RepID=UPI00048B5C14|nr:hypothetical protein [Desulfogranum japonicum]